jgi:hypothetical protein
MLSDEIRAAFEKLPAMVGRVQLQRALEPILGAETIKLVRRLRKARDFPRPARLGHRTLVYQRDEVVKYLLGVLVVDHAQAAG